MQPIIGITAGSEQFDHNITKTCLINKYSQSISQSGGIPVIIPPSLGEEQIDDLANKIDGLVISGGGDIDPVLFNGSPHDRIYGVDPQRDLLEITLTQAFLKNGKPLLGICRGMQVINVAFGGDLYTDIADQAPNSLRHDWFPNFPRDLLSHQVIITPNTKIHQITGSRTIGVNSLHHQGVKCLSDQLTPSATAPDGLIEAFEVQNHPFLIGVQWHPEWLNELDHSRKLFDSFVQASNTNE